MRTIRRGWAGLSVGFSAGSTRPHWLPLVWPLKTANDWQWRKERFEPDGSVPAATLGLGRPTDRACGFCHGVVYQQPEPMLLAPDPHQRMTETQGVVFSAQRISDSAMNVAGKDTLSLPWDVHAERLVSCASCHFSPNHPAYSYVAGGPGHLRFDARRTEITEYLRRPDHQFAKGQSTQATVANQLDGSMRRLRGLPRCPQGSSLAAARRAPLLGDAV